MLNNNVLSSMRFPFLYVATYNSFQVGVTHLLRTESGLAETDRMISIPDM